MMKKRLCVPLALLMVLSLAAGCSGGSGSGSTGQAESQPSPTAGGESASGEPAGQQSAGEGGAPSGTIVYWAQDYCQKVLDSCMDTFAEKYPEITVERETVPNTDIAKKLVLALSAGTGAPDVATIPTYNIAQLIHTDSIVDITDRIAPYVEQLNQASLKNNIRNDRIYAIPLDIGPVGLYYNVKIFEQAGYDASPEAMSEALATWENYLAVARDIKEKTGCYMLSEASELPNASLFQILIWQQNRWYSDVDGNLTLNSPESVRALELLRTLVREDLAYNAQSWTQEWYTGYNEYKVATIPEAVWMGGFMADSVCPDTAGDWRAIPLPAWDAGGIRTSNSGGSCWMMTNQTKNEEAAWALMSHYALDKQSALTSYQAMDQFPALLTSYDDPFFDEGVEFFGGQKTRRVFADLVVDIPTSVVYSKDFAIYEQTMPSALQNIYLNSVNIEDALVAAEQEIESKR